MIDTHCHIHSEDYKLNASKVVEDAQNSGVSQLIIVGEDLDDSRLAIEFASRHDNCFPTVGVHPHHAGEFLDTDELKRLARSSGVVAIGECGLDYYYQNAPREKQLEVLKVQLELANELRLPLSLHIRGSMGSPEDAFNDYFALHDELINRGKTINGVVHSFSSGQEQLKGVLSRSLYVGINGIVTFADTETQATINSVPLESLVLETDSPYLTPVPKRGRINEPKYVVLTAEFLAKQRGMNTDEVTDVTTSNAKNLFNLEV